MESDSKIERKILSAKKANSKSERASSKSELSGPEEETLTRLIRRLKEDATYGSWVRERSRFISALQGLHDMIGNGHTKTQIAKELKKILRKGDNGNMMMNTILYGPPGVGKTTIATHLARIWSSLGFLQQPRKMDALGRATRGMTSDSLMTVGFILLGLCFVLYQAFSALYGVGGLYLVMGIALFLIVIGYYIYTNNYKGSSDAPVNRSREPEQKPEEPVKIVSRSDFIGMYQGFTVKITRDLLESNTGKVLFIDEAYSLVKSRTDQYGREALDEISRYLSENPRKIIVIFAGYSDELKDALFRAQPGLRRRVMWNFECPGYTTDELFSIFELQLHKEGLMLNNKQKPQMRKLFNQPGLFQSQAGDTERLVNYCETEHSDADKADNIIDIDDLTKGIAVLAHNNKVSEINNKDKGVRDLLSEMF